MTFSKPNTPKRGLNLNATNGARRTHVEYGIWARGVDGLTLKSCKFYEDSASKRRKFVFAPSVHNVDSSAVNR